MKYVIQAEFLTQKLKRIDLARDMRKNERKMKMDAKLSGQLTNY